MSNVMRLSDLLARNVGIATHEAIAVVRGVTERVLENGGAGFLVPELHQIELSSDGQISVTGGVKAAEPVRRLGQLLQALLAQSEPPVQLRLIISQATAPQPAYGSVQDYSEALAYFERPDRAAIIGALHLRAAEASDVLQPAPTATLDAMAPLPDADRSTRVLQPQPAIRARRPLRLVLSVAIILTACIAAILYTTMPERILKAQHEVSAGVVVAKVGSAILSGASAVTERAGLGRLVSAEQVTAEAALSPLPSLTKAPLVTHKHAMNRPAPAVSIVAFDLNPPFNQDEMVLPVSDSALRHADAVAMDGGTLPDSTIYSSDSQGVAPPVAVRPQLPQRLPSDMKLDDLGQIELIVLENGTVESVKLLGNRRAVYDAMMLSAAKAWEFRPALKDGRAVKYRKIVWMARQ
jgi:hypothetical protein